MEDTHTFEDGLRLLKCLGYDEYLANQYWRNEFEERWQESYKASHSEPVLAVWAYISNPPHRHSDNTLYSRACNFTSRLQALNPADVPNTILLDSIVDAILAEGKLKAAFASRDLCREAGVLTQAFRLLEGMRRGVIA